MKIIPCPACGRRVKPQKYCPSCGCYLPPLLEEEGRSYDTDYMLNNLTQLSSYLNTYSKGYNTYIMGQKISSPNVLETTDLNNTAFTIYSQTQTTQEQVNQSMKQQIAQLKMAQIDSYLDTQLQSQIQRLESNLRAYKTQLNNNAQSQFILNQMSQMNLEPYIDEKGRLHNCKWTHTE